MAGRVQIDAWAQTVASRDAGGSERRLAARAVPRGTVMTDELMNEHIASLPSQLSLAYTVSFHVHHLIIDVSKTSGDEPTYNTMRTYV